MQEKKQEKDKPTIELTTIATGQAVAYKLPDGRIVGAEEYLTWLGQQIWEIKNAVC